MYKFIHIVLVLILPGVALLAQQDQQMAHYMMEKHLYNPAYTGNYNKKVEFVWNNRAQYISYDKQSSEIFTNYIGAHAPINRSNFAVGGRAIHDKIGFLAYHGVWGTASYKFRLPLGYLAAGVELGLIGRGINHRKLRLTHQDDEVFPDYYGYSFIPDFGIGAYYTLNSFYAGVSVKHMASARYGRLGYQRDFYNYFRNHYYILAGFDYDIDADLTIEPSTLIKMTSNISDLQYDVGFLAKYKQKFYFGLNYRSEQVLTPIISFLKWEYLTFSYSYDISLNREFGRYHGGNHELLIRVIYDLPPTRRKINDPRFYYY